MFDRVLTFAGEIGLVPIPIRIEQSGYIINSLLVPWCNAALDLLVRGVSDFESIDRTWMITLQSGIGPFGMMDRMGLGVVYHVAKLIGETTSDTRALASRVTFRSTSSCRDASALRLARVSTVTRIRPSRGQGSSEPPSYPP